MNPSGLQKLKGMDTLGQGVGLGQVGGGLDLGAGRLAPLSDAHATPVDTYAGGSLVFTGRCWGISVKSLLVPAFHMGPSLGPSLFPLPSWNRRLRNRLQCAALAQQQ